MLGLVDPLGIVVSLSFICPVWQCSPHSWASPLESPLTLTKQGQNIAMTHFSWMDNQISSYRMTAKRHINKIYLKNPILSLRSEYISNCSVLCCCCCYCFNPISLSVPAIITMFQSQFRANLYWSPAALIIMPFLIFLFPSALVNANAGRWCDGASEDAEVFNSISRKRTVLWSLGLIL